MRLSWLRNTPSRAQSPPETRCVYPSLQFNNTTFRLNGDGLRGFDAAREVIQVLGSHPSVHRLSLEENEIGDEGAVALFEYLASPDVVHLSISEINLNSCKIGNKGLDALSRYLGGSGRTSLRELYVQNNKFRPSWSSVLLLASSLNLSRVKILCIGDNPQLGDDFILRFLPNLQSSYLHQLHLEATNITPASIHALVSFLAVDRPSQKAPMEIEDNGTVYTPNPDPPTTARVRELGLNRNKLNPICIQRAIETLALRNFSLVRLQVFDNDFDLNAHFDPSVSLLPSTVNTLTDSAERNSDEETLAPGGPLHNWHTYSQALSHILARNQFLTACARTDALRLLTVARPLIAPYNRHRTAVLSVTLPLGDTFRWQDLPTELQFHILGFISPNLSPPQRARIWNFTSDRMTLPSLTVPSSKVTQRDGFLERVGCDLFEWHPDWTPDSSHEGKIRGFPGPTRRAVRGQGETFQKWTFSSFRMVT